MQYLKTHYGRASNIILDDNINMPHPASAGVSSITSGGQSPFQLKDTTFPAPFNINMIGSTVICDGSLAVVTGFINNQTLVISKDLSYTNGLPYTIYAPNQNEGFSIYIPSTSPNNLQIMTVGGDVITFSLVGDSNASMILPVQAVRVLEDNTALNDLIALW